jgi:hypothetical protein
MMSERKGSMGVTELSRLLVAHRRWSALAGPNLLASSDSLNDRDEDPLRYPEIQTLRFQREKQIDSF